MMKAPPDWEAIEAEYRAGQNSVRAIADAHGITEGAIRKRAKARRWERDLTEKVRAAVKTKLLQYDGGTRAGTQNAPRTEDEIVDEHGARGASVVITHRTVIGRGRSLTERLMSELEASTTHVGELEEMIDEDTRGEKDPRRRNSMMRAVSLPGRATVLRDLATAAKHWVTLERQAFNLDAASDDPRRTDAAAQERQRELLDSLKRIARVPQPGDAAKVINGHAVEVAR